MVSEGFGWVWEILTLKDLSFPGQKGWPGESCITQEGEVQHPDNSICPGPGPLLGLLVCQIHYLIFFPSLLLMWGSVRFRCQQELEKSFWITSRSGTGGLWGEGCVESQPTSLCCSVQFSHSSLRNPGSKVLIVSATR